MIKGNKKDLKKLTNNKYENISKKDFDKKIENGMMLIACDRSSNEFYIVKDENKIKLYRVFE